MTQEGNQHGNEMLMACYNIVRETTGKINNIHLDDKQFGVSAQAAVFCLDKKKNPNKCRLKTK